MSIIRNGWHLKLNASRFQVGWDARTGFGAICRIEPQFKHADNRIECRVNGEAIDPNEIEFSCVFCTPPRGGEGDTNTRGTISFDAAVVGDGYIESRMAQISCRINLSRDDIAPFAAAAMSKGITAEIGLVVLGGEETQRYGPWEPYVWNADQFAELPLVECYCQFNSSVTAGADGRKNIARLLKQIRDELIGLRKEQKDGLRVRLF